MCAGFLCEGKVVIGYPQNHYLIYPMLTRDTRVWYAFEPWNTEMFTAKSINTINIADQRMDVHSAI